MKQEIAIEKISESLIADPLVRAIFLKGSMGRNEHDEFSDIDLYCLVDKENRDLFLHNRIKHLKAYKPIIFQDSVYIIAPQIIAVYEDLLHIDLFTVTSEDFPAKDYFKVLYDPENLLKSYIHTQGLAISLEQYRDDVIDTAWFLFQYKKSEDRGNHIWSVRMLSNVMEHLSRVLLYKYKPSRAQLGLKTLHTSLPASVKLQVEEIFNHITVHHHSMAALLISKLIAEEYDWMMDELPDSDRSQIEPLMNRMLTYHLKKKKLHPN